MDESLKKAKLLGEDYRILVPLFVILSLLFSPLNSSLWLDETVSYWIIRDGPGKLFERALEFQGQSPLYYYILWSFTKLFGTTELALRIPSILFFLGALLCLYRIAIELFNRDVAILASLIFVSVDEVRVAAISARPYAMALCCTFLSAYFFVGLLRKSRKTDLCGFITSSVLCFYAHYLFALIIGAYLIVAIWARKKTQVDFWRVFGFALIVIGVFCVPGLFQLKGLFLRKEEISFLGTASFGSLRDVLFVPYLLIAIGTAVLFLRIMGPLSFDKSFVLKGESLAALIFFLVPPFMFFVLSRFGALSLFLPRYFLWYSGGLALTYSFICLAFKELRRNSLLIPIIFLFLLTHDLDRKWEIEDWRGAVAELEKIADLESVETLFLHSGLVEAGSINILEDPSKRDYLIAPLQYYRTKLNVVLIPSSMNNIAAHGYFKDELKPNIKDKILFMSLKQSIHNENRSVEKMPDSYINAFKHEGLNPKIEKDFGKVKLFLLERQGL
ncbi:MAG: glycosyltransferase family 39 protein [SAR324 cluster bacterium]|uniref:Glycosyltransferase family 39 protein n=1 Tax=SAR324 cluster bacterium TaxID=2024889 RepID=A0A7X9FPS0_9DELT|nr:glycosyltransferase family 39 protein [SAR324 cluster bacterium]